MCNINYSYSRHYITTTVIICRIAGGASCAARLRRLDENRNIILLEVHTFPNRTAVFLIIGKYIPGYIW